MQHTVQTEGAYAPPILSLGEIMDRAVTLCVRHASPLVTIVAMMAVIELLLKIALLGSSAFSDTGLLAAILPSSWVPHGPGRRGNVVSFLTIIDVVDAPILAGAIVSALAAIELGVPIGAGVAYAIVIRRFRGVLALTLLWSGAIVGSLVPIFGILLLIFVLNGDRMPSSFTAVVIALFVLLYVVAVWLVPLSAISLFEGETSREAFWRTWQIACSRRAARRAWIFFIVWLFSSIFGNTACELVGALVFGLTRVAPLFKLVVLAGEVLIGTYLMVVLVLFYDDMRVRLGWKPA